MRLLSQVIAVRSVPSPEIREVTVPSEAEETKIALLERDYETVFVVRRFRAKDQPDGN